MQGYRVPTVEGREVLVRPGYAGDTVQLAIVSTYGNIMEAVSLDRGQLPGVMGALRQANRDADRDLMQALVRRKRESDERYQAALARNPWLTEQRPARERRGLR